MRKPVSLYRVVYFEHFMIKTFNVRTVQYCCTKRVNFISEGELAIVLQYYDNGNWFIMSTHMHF